MEIEHTHCAGLDVHKKTVVAAVIVPDRQEVRTFGTMTSDLLGLSDWLLSFGVTHIAMESTGEYWKPIYNILEENFEVLLVNARHIKQVPGRKTDVMDAEWIADLLRHGLLRGSFIPPLGQRELRELTRAAPILCGNVPPWSIGCRRHWRVPTSSWRVWPAMSWGFLDALCWTQSLPVQPIRPNGGTGERQTA